MRASFDWSQTQELPEHDSFGRPTLWEALISIDHPSQLEALDTLQLHFAELPLFPEERTNVDGRAGVVARAFDGSGSFVYALVPGAIYNLLRESAQAGEEGRLFRAVVLRAAPPGAANADGSVSYEYLVANGFLYRGTGPRGDRVTGQRHDAILGWLAKKVVDAMAAAADAAAEAIRQALAELEKARKAAAETATGQANTKPVDLKVRVFVRNTDPAFATNQPRMIRAWGVRQGQPVPLIGAKVIVEQGLGVFVQRLNEQSEALFQVAPDVPTTLQVYLENPAARMTPGLLTYAVRLPQPPLTSDTVLDVEITDEVANAFAQFTEGWAYLRDVSNYRMPRAEVVVGQLASLLSPGGRSYVPCMNRLQFVTASVPPDLNALGGMIGGGATAGVVGDVVEFLETTDIVMASNSGSRGVPSHEYGHFVLCSMMLTSDPMRGSAAWAEMVVETVTAQSTSQDGRTASNEASAINEGFADFFAGQIAGGINYFNTNPADVPLAGTVATGFRPTLEHFWYCNPNSKRCLDDNIGGTDQQTLGGYLDTSVDEPVSFRSALARTTTLIHDAFDRFPVSSAQDLPNNGAVWLFSGKQALASAYPAMAEDDERISLPGTALPLLIANWSRSAPLLRYRSFHGALAQTMHDAGYPRAMICRLFELHDGDGVCDPRFVPLAWP